MSDSKSLVARCWAAGLCLLAWLLAALPFRETVESLAPELYEFGLPRVCVPYVHGSDVVSTVPFFFSALAWALLGVLLVEVAKIVVAAQRRVALSVALLLFQVTFVIDVLRIHAWDWYGYGLYFARLLVLSHDNPRPEILPIPPPWLSFTLLLPCLGILARPQHRLGIRWVGAAIAALLLVGLSFYLHRELAIDRCLDRGSRWDFISDRCER